MKGISLRFMMAVAFYALTFWCEQAAIAGGPTLMAEGVDSWFVMDSGKLLVVRKGDQFFASPVADDGPMKLIHQNTDMWGAWQLDDQNVGYEVHGEGFAVLNVTTGQATSVLTGPGNYVVYGQAPGRDWVVVMRIEGPTINFAFFQLFPKTGKTRRLYDTHDQYGVEQVEVAPDGSSLVVRTESGKSETFIQRTIDMKSLEVMVEKVPRNYDQTGRQEFSLADDKGKAVFENGLAWLETPSDKIALLEGEGRRWPLPDNRDKPRRLAISRIVDSNHNGTIAREDDDFIEIWLVALDDPKPELIADATQENIQRGWSPDGRYFVYNRIAASPNKASRGDLVIHEAKTGLKYRIEPSRDMNYAMYEGPWSADCAIIAFETILKRRMDPADRLSQVLIYNLKDGTTSTRFAASVMRASVSHCRKAGAFLLVAYNGYDEQSVNKKKIMRYRVED